MMRIEAEMSCGYMGAAKPTASEEAESAAAAQAAKDAQAGIDAEALKAGELTAEELARLIELSLGVCGGSSSPASAASKAAIQPRCGEADVRDEGGRRVMRAVCCALALLATIAAAPRAGITATTLAVPPLEWHSGAPGMDRATFVIQADPNGWHTRVELVRMDPAQFSFRCAGGCAILAPAWTVDRAPSTATLAMNIGLYSGIVPWGWTVMEGQEVRPPGQGPLSTAVAWDAAGRMRWLAPEQIDDGSRRRRRVEAIQSYPTLLDASGDVPLPLRQRGLGVDIDHRDGRLAIGELDDGRMLIAMTRFYPLGDLSPAIPLGLTLDEMARLMTDLGCRRAVALDGGISAQLMVREGQRTRTWRGWRAVPFGLIARTSSLRSPSDRMADSSSGCSRSNLNLQSHRNFRTTAHPPSARRSTAPCPRPSARTPTAARGGESGRSA